MTARGATCIIGGNNYGHAGVVRSAIASLPAASSLLLTSTLGVSRMAATFAALADPPFPVTYLLWKQKPARLLVASLLIAEFLLFADGSQDYRIDSANGGSGILPLAIRARIPFRLYLPDGSLSQNPFASLAVLCSTPARGLPNGRTCVAESPDHRPTCHR